MTRQTARAAKRRVPQRGGRDGWPFVIVANRLPVTSSRRKDRRQWTMSPGGLVSALTPIARRASGGWVGWSGGVDEQLDPFEHEGITQVPVTITRGELQKFYHGFCNRTLWPLYHDAVVHPEYHRHWWRSYELLNSRFADTTAEHVAGRGAAWIQDYQLQLVPGFLRERRPDLRLGFFLHIPFPPLELFARLPWRRQILHGMLGADVLGFQTDQSVENFLRAAERYGGATVTAEGALSRNGRPTTVRAYPISIDFERYDRLSRTRETASRAARMRERLGGNRRIILGVDRLDYTKGIDRRLRAFQELLTSGLVKPDEVVMVQVAVPSRERVVEYQQQRRRVEELVGQINGEFAEVGEVVHYLHRNLQFESLIATYRAGDVMMVTPLCDGMNLVAKEYVASRFDDTGALILSEFAGAAHELHDALLVNPHDVDGIAAAIHEAWTLDAGHAAARMHTMREMVRTHTVHDWAGRFVSDLVPPSLRAQILDG